jgi:hypothetical protein
MKTTSKAFPKILLAALAGLFVLTGASTLRADDFHHDYRHDHDGYRDRHDHYHSYVYWHDHRGYWGYRGPVRVFINCD